MREFDLTTSVLDGIHPHVVHIDACHSFQSTKVIDPFGEYEVKAEKNAHHEVTSCRFRCLVGDVQDTAERQWAKFSINVLKYKLHGQNQLPLSSRGLGAVPIPGNGFSLEAEEFFECDPC